jgi:hypothetical protein
MPLQPMPDQNHPVTDEKPANKTNAIVYAVKVEGVEGKYDIHVVKATEFYGKNYIQKNLKDKEAYLLNIAGLDKKNRQKLLKEENKTLTLVKLQLTEAELKAIFGNGWKSDENKIEFQEDVNYNFAKLTHFKHINTEKEAKSFVEVLNARLKENAADNTRESFELEKFKKDSKNSTTIYTLAAGQTKYTFTQNNDGTTDITSDGDAVEFSKRLLETADILRANTKANLKASVVEAIKDAKTPEEKYQIAKQMLGIVIQKTQQADNKNQPVSQATSPSSKKKENTKPSRPPWGAPKVTFDKLAPIYKKKDNNKDDEFLDYPKYEKMADDWFKRGYLINAKPMIEQKDEQGNFVFSEDARKKLSDIFDITKRDEKVLNTFCDYYMGPQTQADPTEISAEIN